MSASESAPPRPAPATVVVTQQPRAGREAEFRRWQAAVDDAAAGFPGFLGAEVTPPGDVRSEWSVVYRFDDTTHLKRWLDSATRRELLARGAGFFARPATQHVLIDEPGGAAVTAVVSHSVAAGRESEFIAWQDRVTEVERTFRGFRGSELHRPIPGLQDDWTIIYSFATTEDLDRWLESPQRQALLAEAPDFHDFEVHRIANPYGSWFPPSETGAEGGPASWKTALSVLVGLYPTVVILTLAIDEIWPGAPLWISLLIGNILSVSLLTWVVMPIVTRALRFWLRPSPHRDPRTDLLGLACSVGFLTFAAVLFYLVTRVWWTLP
ncbi:antibiotic biosynthesis monooxygenase [Nocardia sp. NPDC059177]|uniref:antibiotic biosynthesis monooxygenase n=1 Tax=Nocardia sp. NPDC059177 TaxID=3346759 RepID=UPI0036BFC0A9